MSVNVCVHVYRSKRRDIALFQCETDAAMFDCKVTLFTVSASPLVKQRQV